MPLKLSVISEYSLWWSLICIALGFGYAMILYYKDKKHDFKPGLIKFLFAFRLIVITIISFLLLAPMIKTISYRIEKPVIIFAQDNSKSIVFSKDSTFYRNTYADKVSELLHQLKENYEVKSFVFGDAVSEGTKFTFNNLQTDISAINKEINGRFDNRNIGALIIASDGLYNNGNNPLYEFEQATYPIYTVGLGDTNVQKDLKISKVNYNQMVYLGNQFPIEVVAIADKCLGEKMRLTISKDKNVLSNKIVDIASAHHLETIAFQFDATQPGMQHYRIAITPVDGEVNKQNNVQDIYFEVLDSREKILILSGAPHPDVSAIKQGLESSRIYQVDASLAENFSGDISSYNVIILDQLPFKGRNYDGLLSNINKSNIPLLYILGNSSDIPRFNALKTGLEIKQTVARTDEVSAVATNDFDLFTVSDEIKNAANVFPDLAVPYGDYSKSVGVSTLFLQKVGNFPTNKPLICFNNSMDKRIGIIAGEGIWHWRLYNYLQKGNQQIFNEILGKLIQYLAVKSDRGKFRVTNTGHFNENESVIFDAELYNDSYELVNQPEIGLSIFDASKHKFDFVFSHTAESYHLNAGMFPVGEYSFTATASLGKNKVQKKGAFVVSAINNEARNLVADHQLLKNLAQRHAGIFVTPDQMKNIAEHLKSREDVKPVSYTEKKFTHLTNYFLIFLILILLLGTEWFLRKFNGGY